MGKKKPNLVNVGNCWKGFFWAYNEYPSLKRGPKFTGLPVKAILHCFSSTLRSWSEVELMKIKEQWISKIHAPNANVHFDIKKTSHLNIFALNSIPRCNFGISGFW